MMTLVNRIRSHRTGGEVARFLLVGGMAVAIDAVTYGVLTQWNGVAPPWAKRISFALGSVWAFFMNKFFTFGQRRFHSTEPFLFIAVYAAGWFFNSVTHDFAFALAGNKPLAFLCATGVSTCTNFAGQKWIVFRKGRKQP